MGFTEAVHDDGVISKNRGNFNLKLKKDGLQLSGIMTTLGGIRSCFTIFDK